MLMRTPEGKRRADLQCGGPQSNRFANSERGYADDAAEVDSDGEEEDDEADDAVDGRRYVVDDDLSDHENNELKKDFDRKRDEDDKGMQSFVVGESGSECNTDSNATSGDEEYPNATHKVAQVNVHGFDGREADQPQLLLQLLQLLIASYRLKMDEQPDDTTGAAFFLQRIDALASHLEFKKPTNVMSPPLIADDLAEDVNLVEQINTLCGKMFSGLDAACWGATRFDSSNGPITIFTMNRGERCLHRALGKVCTQLGATVTAINTRMQQIIDETLEIGGRFGDAQQEQARAYDQGFAMEDKAKGMRRLAEFVKYFVETQTALLAGCVEVQKSDGAHNGTSVAAWLPASLLPGAAIMRPYDDDMIDKHNYKLVSTENITADDRRELQIAAENQLMDVEEEKKRQQRAIAMVIRKAVDSGELNMETGIYEGDKGQPQHMHTAVLQLLPSIISTHIVEPAIGGRFVLTRIPVDDYLRVDQLKPGLLVTLGTLLDTFATALGNVKDVTNISAMFVGFVEQFAAALPPMSNMVTVLRVLIAHHAFDKEVKVFCTPQRIARAARAIEDSETKKRNARCTAEVKTMERKRKKADGCNPTRATQGTIGAFFGTKQKAKRVRRAILIESEDEDDTPAPTAPEELQYERDIAAAMEEDNDDQQPPAGY
jgi:hypothetical protein